MEEAEGLEIEYIVPIFVSSYLLVWTKYSKLQRAFRSSAPDAEQIPKICAARIGFRGHNSPFRVSGTLQLKVS